MLSPQNLHISHMLLMMCQVCAYSSCCKTSKVYKVNFAEFFIKVANNFVRKAVLIEKLDLHIENIKFQDCFRLST